MSTEVIPHKCYGQSEEEMSLGFPAGDGECYGRETDRV